MEELFYLAMILFVVTYIVGNIVDVIKRSINNREYDLEQETRKECELEHELKDMKNELYENSRNINSIKCDVDRIERYKRG